MYPEGLNRMQRQRILLKKGVSDWMENPSETRAPIQTGANVQGYGKTSDTEKVVQ